MRNIQLSIIALIAMGTLGYAGGDISPVTVYETEDVQLATEAYEESYVTPIIEEVVEVEPKVVEQVVVAPIPVKVVEPKEISPSGFYAGLGITGARFESNCDCKTGGAGTETNVALAGRVGYDFNKYIGIEARGIQSVAGDDGASISHLGLFLKPMVPIMNATNLYALIGAAKTSTKGNLQKVSAESLALGAGVEVDLSADVPRDGRYSREFDGKGDQEKGVGLFMDYERLVVKSDAPALDTVTLGVTYDF
jgi:OOP family OmpA-OmpF porin